MGSAVVGSSAVRPRPSACRRSDGFWGAVATLLTVADRMGFGVSSAASPLAVVPWNSCCLCSCLAVAIRPFVDGFVLAYRPCRCRLDTDRRRSWPRLPSLQTLSSVAASDEVGFGGGHRYGCRRFGSASLPPIIAAARLTPSDSPAMG
ncbi:hypothetical protein ACLOJK_005699 [Asimina triloba]